MKKLRIQAFFDNSKGHQKQTQAIIKALQKMVPVEIFETVVPKPSFMNRIANLFQLVIPFLSSGTNRTGKRPDLIIGTGSNCHLPMLIAAKSYPTAKTVTCMTPEKVLLPRFDLCFVPYHDLVKEKGNIFRTFGPPCPVEDQHRHRPGQGLILIGGINPKSHFWQTSKVVDQIKKIIADDSMRWIISSSPRTPEETIEAVKKIYTEIKHVEFFLSKDTPEGWVEEQYNTSKIAWVTADSISMVYEALSAGCMVGILPVEWKKAINKFQRSLSRLQSEKLVVYYDDWLKGTCLPGAGKTFNEAERCAHEILRRCWPDRPTKV